MIDGSNGKEQKSPNGPSEKLLCEDCDGELGIYDEYALKIFIDGDPSFHPHSNNQALLFNNVDYKKMKLFVLSLLWRMSISSVDIFQKVYLGSFEEKIRRIILSGDTSKEDFSIFFLKYNAGDLGDIANKNIADPIRYKIEGVNFYRIYFPNTYEILIKVDQKKAPEFLNALEFKNNSELIVLIAGDYINSDRHKIMLDLAKILKK
jgi:hypothetical protein